MSFSERNNITQAIPLQDQFITPELKNALWNPVSCLMLDMNHNFIDGDFIFDIWTRFLEWHVENFDRDAIGEIKAMFLEASWNKIYDFMEYLADYIARSWMWTHQSEYVSNWNTSKEWINTILAKHNSTYRLQNTKIIRIVEPVLLTMIEHVQNNSLETMKAELNKAITKLSERGDTKNPYIYNEAAEAAIHMLEAYFVAKTGESTLSKGLVALKKKGKVVGTFNTAIDKLYVFSSDQLRHATKENQIQLEYSDALYILHFCLALVNYLECPGTLFQLADQFTGVS